MPDGPARKRQSSAAAYFSQYGIDKPAVPVSDVERLREWQLGIENWLSSELPAGRAVWIVFRPSEAQAEALMRLSIEYPQIVRRLQGSLEFVEQNYQAVCREQTELHWDTHGTGRIRNAFVGLCVDIEAAVRTIEAAERREQCDDAAVLACVRAALRNLPNGATAKPDAVLRAARVGRQPGRKALRELERTGEYTGFARPLPKRYRQQ